MSTAGTLTERARAAAYERYREAGAWPFRTLATEARDRAERTPDAVAFLGESRPATYASLVGEAEALAASLVELGLRQGDVVSFQLPNWLEAVTIDLAASMLGLVCNPIVPIYREAEIGFILSDCGSRTIFIPEVYRGYDYFETIERLRPKLPQLRHVITVRSKRADAPSFAELVEAGAGRPAPRPEVDPEAVKVMMYTSGTTGPAKGVLHNHNTLSRILRVCTRYWGIEEGDVVLMPSPVTHTTGYSNGMELPFIVGTRTVFMERWNADEAVTLIDRYGVNATVGATPFLQELLDAAEAAGSRLASLKAFACGGAPVPPSLIRRANELFATGRAFRVFGSTEAPLVTMGFMGPSEAELAATTDGKIIDYEVKIVDDEGAALPQGADGEILVRGPSLFLRYADSRQTGDAFDAEGYFRTGDVGHLTADHAIVITARKKDLIIRGGENISPKEIEDALHRHPDIQEAAAVAMPHARLGETVCVYAIARAGSEPTVASVAAHLAELGIAKQKYPERVELLQDFPRTPSGKIRKDVLRRTIAEKLGMEQQLQEFGPATASPRSPTRGTD